MGGEQSPRAGALGTLLTAGKYLSIACRLSESQERFIFWQ